MADITKVGLLFIREGRILLCRKGSGTRLLILPGGRIERGETALECLRREVQEELGNVQLRSAIYLASYVDRAAGEDQRTVEIALYRGELEGEPQASSEIA